MSPLFLALTHFGLGLISSFLGALPFGTVNLSVVDTTVNKSFRAGLEISVAASLIEIFQSFLAVYCGMQITDQIAGNIYTQVFVFLLFVGLGILYLLKKDQKTSGSGTKYPMPDFAKGIVLALINPQALPFWVFVITWFQSSHLLTLDPHGQLTLIVIFLLGVWAGKLLALILFGYLSLIIVNKLQTVSGWMNKIIGSILLLIGAFQGIKLLI